MTPIVTVKPGYKTTEFWGKVAIQLVALVVAGGFLSANTGNELAAATPLLVALASAAVPEIAYAISRGHVKAAVAGAATASLLPSASGTEGPAAAFANAQAKDLTAVHVAV